MMLIRKTHIILEKVENFSVNYEISSVKIFIFGKPGMKLGNEFGTSLFESFCWLLLNFYIMKLAFSREF